MADTEAVKSEDVDDKQQIVHCNISITCPTGKLLKISSVYCNEAVSTLKSALLDYIETCLYTNYNFSLINGDEIYNDYTEITSILLDYVRTSTDSTTEDQTVIELPLKIVLEPLDAKKARVQVKRVREIIHNPPINVDLINNTELKSKVDTLPKIDFSDKTPLDYPSYDTLLSTADPSLGKFYDESLSRLSSMDNTWNGIAHTMTSQVTQLSLSDWNPPPAYRQLQGNLAYIQVQVHEGVFQITAIHTGFYVNKSSGDHFDPSPATKSHYHTTLFEVLISLSPSLRQMWETHCLAVYRNSIHDPIRSHRRQYISPLENLMIHFNAGRCDNVCPPQWNFPTTINNRLYLTHKRDNYRNLTDFCDNFGASGDKGPVREWNDELHSIRDMTTQSVTEKITKARLLYRTTVEFVDCAKQAVMGIVQGHITPLNPMDPIPTQVFIYNNIFFSRAVDTKETFKLCSGDNACHKVAGHDIKNQRILQALNIKGLSYVLSVIIDYKGYRFVAQSIIPGVLSGGGGAKLMYGVMEFNKKLTCKNQSLAIMKEMGVHLHISPRTVPLLPVQVSEQFAVENTGASVVSSPDDPNTTSEPSTIRVDDEDEVTPSPESGLPHVGPIEGKILKGTDGCLYALEMVRLTPRDANYVPKYTTTIGGTGNISNQALKQIDMQIASTYVLRHELISIFLQRKILTKRQALVTEYTSKYTQDTSADTSENTENPPNMTAEEKAELEKKLSEITIDSLEFDYSPNTFVLHPEHLNKSFPDDVHETTGSTIGQKESLSDEELNHLFITSDMNQDQAVEDEALVREISHFLYDQMLPSLTTEIRQNELSIMGGDMLIECMHTRGINIRYLGQLAILAVQEENEDIAMSAIGKQRIQMMPQYWLELLEMEMIARGVRRVLYSMLTEHDDINRIPIQTLVSVLNHILGGPTVESTDTTKKDLKSENMSTGTKKMEAIETSKAITVDTIEINQKKKKKNKKSSTHGGSTTGSSSTADMSVEFVPKFPDAAENKVTFLSDVLQSIQSRFLYKLTLVNALPSTTDATDASFTFLSARIPRLPLLRRICILCGIRIHTKDYAFDSYQPFTVNDIVTLVPRVKASTGVDGNTDVPIIPEAISLINTARRLLAQGQYPSAYDLVHEAMVWLQDCVGPIHRDYRMAVNELTSVCLTANEYEQALPTASKNLTLSIQIDGLDSYETIQQHMKLVNIHMGILNNLKEILVASLSQDETLLREDKEKQDVLDKRQSTLRSIQDCKYAIMNHLLCAKYLIEIVGGPRHPDLINIYLKLGTYLAEEDGHFQTGIVCLITQVKLRLTDLIQFSSVTSLIAELLYRKGFLQQAVDEQRQSYKVISELFGNKDTRTIEAKSRLETYIRAVGEAQIKNKELLINRQVELSLAQTKEKIEQLKITEKSTITTTAGAGVGGGKNKSLYGGQGSVVGGTVTEDDWLLDDTVGVMKNGNGNGHSQHKSGSKSKNLKKSHKK